MKKHIVLFISALAIGFGFTSCSSDDDAAAPSVVGKWKLEKQEERDENNNVTGTWEIEYDCETNKNHFFDVKENGEVDIISYRSDCSERIETTQWERVSNKIIFHLDGEFEAIELTNSRLVLKYTNASSGNSWLLYLKR